MSFNPIPNKNKEHIKAFCRSIAPGQKPVYVTHQPMPGAPLKECFSIVPKQIAAHGGKQVIGWAILELKKIWLEAEFHTVWERPDGTLIDLTPRELNVSRTLFLPDPSRNYEGIQVAPIYKALSKNPKALRFIELQKEYFRETNKGDLAFQKEIPRTAEIIAIENEMKQLQETIFA